MNKNPYYNPEKRHHRPNGFENEIPTNISTGDLLRWMFKRYRYRLPGAPSMGYRAFQQAWLHPFQLPAKAESYLTWLGHSSLYIHTPDCALLTDPVFSLRASPMPFGEPKRKTPCEVDVDQLPRLDFILISHNHYDHLDHRTIMHLLAKFPKVTIVVPLGLGRWFKQRGAHNIIELDWWDKLGDGKPHQIVSITAVPAQHWSKRGLFDKNQTLWCGYIIEIAGKTLYFAGDTGYSETLKPIGEQFSIDLGLIPIGAYAPRWFMAEQHISPKESILLHQLLKIQKSIGIHWGVFELTDETIDEPPRYLAECLAQSDLSPGDFQVLKINESLDFSDF